MKALIERINISLSARVIWCIVFALPVPLSLLSVVGSLLSLSMLAGDWSTVTGAVQGISALAFMILAATYWITYLVMLILVLVRKKIGLPGLIPIFHLGLFAGLFFVNVLVG